MMKKAWRGSKMDATLEDLVRQTKDGDQDALESIVRGIQDRVYGLALRMLGYPADAEDAAQEILIKIVTRLGGFRQESKFTTWVYRVAANHLLTTRKRLAEQRAASFDDYEPAYEIARAAEWQQSVPEAERRLIAQEVMLGCTQGILQCLDRRHRIAYILGEIFSLSSRQGAYILDISAAAYRKRLSRARERIQTFMLDHCRLVKPDIPCHCDRIAPHAIQINAIDPQNLLFAGHPCHPGGRVVSPEHLQELDALQRIAALFQNHPDYAAPETFLDRLKSMIDSGPFQLIEGLH
jgi:RNA polymerase sigma factor (sigma-70 family)